MTLYKKYWVKKYIPKSLKDIIAVNFMRTCSDGDMKHVTKAKVIRFPEEFASAFESLVDEYNTILGDKKYRYYKEMQSELIRIKNDHAKVSAALIVLLNKRSDKALEVLKSYRMVKKDATKITHEDVQRIKGLVHKWIVQCKMIEQNLNNVFKDNKESGLKMDVERAAREHSITLTKWMGVEVSLDKINAYDYACLHSRYNAELEEQKKQLNKTKNGSGQNN